MTSKKKHLLLELPSPPGLDIYREYGGCFGVARKVNRSEYGYTGWVQNSVVLTYAISALMNSRCEYYVFDGQAQRSTFNQVINVIRKIEPDIVISLLSLPSLNKDLQILDEIKKISPHTTVIGLGTVCNVIPEEVLKSNIDLVIRGTYPYYNIISNIASITQGRNTEIEDLRRISGAVYAIDGNIIYTPLEKCPENLNRINLKAYHEIPIDPYASETVLPSKEKKRFLTILTGVGCPYECVYCPYPVGHGTKIIEKSLENIVNEIEFLKTNYNLGAFYFKDPFFTSNETRVLRLCDEFLKKQLDIHWIVETRADAVTKDMLVAMKKAGCYQINFGVETGDPTIHSTVGKHGLKIKDCINAFRMTKEVGLQTQAHLLFGLPGETDKTWRETYNLVRNLNPDYINLNIATPYPGTRLYELAKKRGWIEDHNWENYTSFKPVMRTEELSLDQLEKTSAIFSRKLHFLQLKNNTDYRDQWIKCKLKNIFKKILK